MQARRPLSGHLHQPDGHRPRHRLQGGGPRRRRDRDGDLGQWWKDIGAGFTTDEVVIHFHDTRGWGLANSLEALRFGFRHFDSSLGAIGGQPKTGAADYHTGFSGNTCTEDLVGAFEEMGVATGIDLPKMLAMGKRAEEILDRPLRSNLIRAGLVPHGGIQYDKRFGILDEDGAPTNGGPLRPTPA
jgi:hypothetical protein